ncbi:heme ABC exporter ATP-binding protein CcmA [Roseobacteraceae bacterium S113]
MMLRLRDVAVTRGGVPVLEGINFALEPGRALILRGPNGSGKTTLLRTIAGLQPPASGEIEGDQEQVAYAAHADGLKSTLTVAENLRFWASVFATGNISAAVSAFELATLLERPAGALSAGQKRRLGLARLMVTGRPIWVLDEPTVSLDAAMVARFAETMRAHLGQGGAALIATHIDLGLEGEVFDVTPYKATPPDISDFDEAFA